MGRSRLVWLIEDDALLRSVVRGVLEGAGYAVIDARPNDRTFDGLMGENFDVVVTDILMPNMDGIEIIRRIRAAKPTVGIVAMSGGGSHFHAAPALNASLALGAGEILFKPFSGEELLEAVRRVTAGESGDGS